MKIQFEAEQSIRERKLVPIYKSFWSRLGSVYFFIGSFLAGTIMTIVALRLFIGMIYRGFDLLSLLLLFLPFATIGFLFLFAFLHQNKLIKLKGIDKDKNLIVVVELLEEKFNIEINKNSNEVIRFHRQPTYWKSGIRMIIILDKNDVYINIARFNHWGIESPLYSFFDYLKIISVRKDFEYLIS